MKPEAPRPSSAGSASSGATDSGDAALWRLSHVLLEIASGAEQAASEACSAERRSGGDPPTTTELSGERTTE